MNDIKTQIHTFLNPHFKGHDVQDDEDIFALGFVNSLFAMQLVMFVEQTFNVTVEDDDLDIDNFRTVNNIAALITRKTAS